MNFHESKTKENLARAFAGECQDGARYQFIAKQAVSDGFSFISDTMKMLAKHEMAHARVFYEHLINNCNGEFDNIEISAGYPFEPYELDVSLNSAAGVELSEHKNIYPAFARVAKDEGFLDVSKSFLQIAEVEFQHHNILKYLNDCYHAKKLYKSSQQIEWKCSNCGHTEQKKEAWKTCPLCTYPQGYVMIPLENAQK